MSGVESEVIIEKFLSFLSDKAFPCVGARAAAAKGNIRCMTAGHMGCPKDDWAILHFLYDFIDDYRHSPDIFHSAAILFDAPLISPEEMFDTLLWQRLQSLADLDAENYRYDERVDADPSSPQFSFSLKEEAFFVIGLHPASSREPRRFDYPVLTFNPHAQFEKLRETDGYDHMKAVIRKRDIRYSGSVNPMLDDFGNSSEVYQYSGRIYDERWQCPLKINHGKIRDNPSA